MADKISLVDRGVPKDIHGNTISVGDEVYYARKRSGTANGELVKTTVTALLSPIRTYRETRVKMGTNISTAPSSQIAKI